MSEEFRVLGVSREVVDELNQLMDNAKRRFVNEGQLREAAGSITANIREAYGRDRGKDRNQFLRFARGSAEEADERLRTNVAAKRIGEKPYWRLHNRLSVIRKMLNKLLGE
jgi:four helix bundle protein